MAFLIIAISFTTPPLFTQPLYAAERTFPIRPFKAIQINGPFEVSIMASPSRHVTAIVQDVNQFNDFEVKVQGTTLFIRPKSRRNRPLSGRQNLPRSRHSTRKAKIRFIVGNPHIRELNVQGAANVTVDRIHAPDVRVRQSGYGSLTISDIQARRLQFAALGAVQISLAGKAEEARFELLGSHLVEAGQLSLKRLRLEQNGAGITKINVSQKADLSVNGNGEVIVYGKAQCDIRSIGASAVECNAKHGE